MLKPSWTRLLDGQSVEIRYFLGTFGIVWSYSSDAYWYKSSHLDIPRFAPNLSNQPCYFALCPPWKKEATEIPDHVYLVPRIRFWSLSLLLRSFRSSWLHKDLRQLHPILTPWVTCASAPQIWVKEDVESQLVLLLVLVQVVQTLC